MADDGEFTGSDDPIRALIEMFSKPIKGGIPPHRKWIYDPEKQKFVRDPICLMIDEAINQIFPEAEQGEEK